MNIGDTCPKGHMVKGHNALGKRRNYECRTCHNANQLRRYYERKPPDKPKRRALVSDWCAPAFIDEYNRLAKCMPASMAKPIILRAMADAEKAAAAAEKARRAAMTPFERQMDAINRGVGLVQKFEPVRSYDRTLGGVSSI